MEESCKSSVAIRHFKSTVLVSIYNWNKANYYSRTKIKVTYKNIQSIQASLLWNKYTKKCKSRLHYIMHLIKLQSLYYTVQMQLANKIYLDKICVCTVCDALHAIQMQKTCFAWPQTKLPWISQWPIQSTIWWQIPLLWRFCVFTVVN